LALFLSFQTLAADSVPTDQSIKNLLDAMNAKQMLEKVRSQNASSVKSSILSQLGGKQINPQQEKVLNATAEKISSIMAEVMTWENFQTIYSSLYKKNFTQDEVNALTAFYKTPAGKSAMNKMPAVTQQIILESQKLLVPVQDRIQQAAQEGSEEFRKAQ
jgi:uncharacterized protein